MHAIAAADALRVYTLSICICFRFISTFFLLLLLFLLIASGFLRILFYYTVPVRFGLVAIIYVVLLLFPR